MAISEDEPLHAPLTDEDYRRILHERNNGNKVQNGTEARKMTAFLDNTVIFLHNRLPKQVDSNVFTFIGLACQFGSSGIQEYQNYKRKYNFKATSAAIVLAGTSRIVDLMDGKKATLERADMAAAGVDPKIIEDHERFGQWIDPLTDGMGEGFRSGLSALRAHLQGNTFGRDAALVSWATTNLARTAKSLTGAFGRSTPEMYNLTDPRFFGTSTGRVAPNYSAVLFPCTQPLLDVVTSVGSVAVGVDRISKISRDEGDLDEKQTDFALTRFKWLGALSVVNAAAAFGLYRAFNRLDVSKATS